MADISANALAHVFGHAKNSRLTSKDENAEPQGGHVSWALNHSQSQVIGEVASDVDTAESRSKADEVEPTRWGEVFGHMKNAGLVAENNDSGAAEDMAGHINWANNNPTSAVKSEIKRFARIVREILEIA